MLAHFFCKRFMAKREFISKDARAAPQCFRKIRRESKTARNNERFNGGPTLKAMGSTPVHAHLPWLPVPG